MQRHIIKSLAVLALGAMLLMVCSASKSLKSCSWFLGESWA